MNNATNFQSSQLILLEVFLVPCNSGFSQRGKNCNMPMGGIYRLIRLPDFGYFFLNPMNSASLMEHDSSHTADDCYQYDVTKKYPMLQQ